MRKLVSPEGIEPSTSGLRGYPEAKRLQQLPGDDGQLAVSRRRQPTHVVTKNGWENGWSILRPPASGHPPAPAGGTRGSTVCETSPGSSDRSRHAWRATASTTKSTCFAFTSCSPTSTGPDWSVFLSLARRSATPRSYRPHWRSSASHFPSPGQRLGSAGA